MTMPSRLTSGTRPARRTSGIAGAVAGGIAATALGFLWLPPSASAMDGKLGLHFVYMSPERHEVPPPSPAGWGFGVQLTVPTGPPARLAGVAGIEYVNLLDESLVLYDPQGRYVAQRTDQYLGRLYLGAEVGSHGRSAFRPHLGANVALVLYGISSNIEVGGSPGQPVGNAYGDHKTMFGYDVSAGLDINPWNTVSFDLGARYVKTYGTPQQLGLAAVPVDPVYVQGYLAVAFSLAWLRRGMGR